ncbi:Nucleotide-binding universal stress protein, UspA family [Variovorax sp. HW608]|uniref:universal stress protein n=1 Tax=Variovorax sp. HW608 TaxID=1034889 RepID=UPI00081FBBC0|nr:universal stress protein [Variovorax sp. HW608]SCK27829.1 Nucleotide-binding universal stress protein, UspA family [Variovorax sp. HW608]
MYQRILVPVDGSATSNCGLEEAIRIAKLTHGQLRLFHVIDDLSFALALGSDSGLSNDLLRSLRGEATRILDAAQATARAAGIEADTRLCDAFPGPVQDKVASEARNWGAELIVLGTHGRRGAKRLMLGSGAERILRVAPVPVLLVRAPDEEDAAAELLRASASALAAAGE